MFGLLTISYLKKLESTCEMGRSGTFEWESPCVIWLGNLVLVPVMNSICILRRPSFDSPQPLPIDVVSLETPLQTLEGLSLLEVEVPVLLIPIENLNIYEQKQTNKLLYKCQSTNCTDH